MISCSSLPVKQMSTDIKLMNLANEYSGHATAEVHISSAFEGDFCSGIVDLC